MKLLRDVPLSGYTSLHAGGNADNLIELEPGDRLADTIAKQAGQVRVLGWGTNCLISDKGLPGSVIVNRFGKIEKLTPTRLKVDSGVNWDDFIQKLVGENLWGLEFTSGIPGGSGAAVTGNIAAYGHKVADAFVEATIFDSRDASVNIWPKDRFAFEYRRSILQKPENTNLVVVDATFELSQEPTVELEYEYALKAAEDLGLRPDSLQNRREIILEARRRAGSLLPDISKGPFTAGSFFKNPTVEPELAAQVIKYEEKPRTREQLMKQNIIHGENKHRVSASHILLAAGFHRGQTWGNVRLHPEHILKIENTGGATASEIYDVVQRILETVRQKLGVELEPEVKFLGEF